jgi:outer membrane protein assembly factor BamB
VGQGFSGPVVQEEKVILFTRIGDEEVVECLDAAKGTTKWKHRYPTKYNDDFGFDAGPRATPTIAEGKVFTVGAEGLLTCLDVDAGNRIWSVEAKRDYKAPKGFFGIACSPLVEGKAVLVNIGGANGAGIVALDKDTGKLLWKSTEDEASYSSPVAATLQGHRAAIFFTRAGLRVVDPGTGKLTMSFPWRSAMNASVNAAVPLVVNSVVFLSASYGVGAVVLDLSGKNPKKVWSGDDILSNHYASSVHHKGFLYGFDGRQEQGPRLRCVELATGKVNWTKENLGAGTVTLAHEQLVVLTEKGELIVADATPKTFSPKVRTQVLPNEVRAYPALANGCLYARSKAKFVCLRLNP